MLPSLLESFTCYLLFSFLLGDNVIVGSYDCRLCWFDLDLSTRPYRTLRYIYIYLCSVNLSSLMKKRPSSM